MSKKRSHWFRNICLILLVLFLVAVIGTYIAIRQLLTSPVSLGIRPETANQQETVQLDTTLREAFEAYDRGKANTLRLTDRELNQLLTMSTDYQYISEMVAVKIEDNVVTVSGSLPLKSCPLFRKRFINGKITVRAKVSEKELLAECLDVQINGRNFPKNWLMSLNRTFSDKALKLHSLHVWPRRLQPIGFEDGALEIRFNGTP